MLDRFNTKEFFLRCIVVLLAAHALDVLSTLFLEHMWAGCEGNQFLRNPENYQMLVNRSVATKLFGSILFAAPACAGMWYATRNWFLTSIPVIGLAYETYMGPVWNNLTWVVMNLLSHIRS